MKNEKEYKEMLLNVICEYFYGQVGEDGIEDHHILVDLKTLLKCEDVEFIKKIIKEINVTCPRLIINTGCGLL